MRKIYLQSLLVLTLAATSITFLSGCGNKANKQIASSEMEEYDGPGARLEFELERMRDPATGKVPWAKLLQAKLETEQARTSANAINALSWIERGPDGDFPGPNGNSRPPGQQTAGRIRAAMVDSLDPTRKTVWVGGVDGGLWKTTDITTAPANWVLVDDFLSNLSIAAITQDPRPGFQNIMYFCTGESYGNADAVQGVGVFKSTNSGATWTFLPSTSSFLNGTRILCDFEGNVYLGTRGSGLQRSTNGGTNWTNITPSGLSSDISDLEISSTAGPARLHVTTGIFSTSGYRYTDIPGTVTSAGWTSPTTPYSTFNQRSEIAVSGNVLYALPCNGSYQAPTVWKSINGGDTWATAGSTPATASGGTFTSGQGWYDLSMAINPSNPDECIIGGIDCAKTVNGGTSWTRISAWFGTSVQYVHADQHKILWWEGGSKLMFTCDGGVHYSANGGTTITDRNKGLRLKQFYSIAIHPTIPNYFIAGAQDNGMHRLNHPGLDSSIEVVGGDGCYAAIDQDEPWFQFGSYVYNVYRRTINNGQSWTTPVNNQSSGRFVNPWDYDNADDRLYACNAAGNYLRWNDPQTGNSTTVVSVPQFGSGNVSAVHVSPYTANRVYFGLGNGPVVRVDDAHTGTTATGTVITPAGAAGYVNCIVTGSSDQNLIACYSNYNVMNIFVSTNGGTTWTGIDGNLPNMPVRWALFHPDTDTKVFIATETGVWETDLINGSSTVWTANNTFPNVRVDMIKYRTSDRTIAAGTHGRGIWSATVPLPSGFDLSNPAPAVATCPAPATMSITLGTISNGGFTNPISFTASGNPPGTTVSFAPNPVTPGNNTVVTLNNTNILASNSYVISVTGTATGAPPVSRNLTYTINPGTGPSITTQPSSQTVCAGANVTFTAASASATSFQWQVSTDGGATWNNIAGATTNAYTINGVTASLNGNQYRVIAGTQCGSTNSTAATLTVNTAPAITTQPQNASVCTGGNHTFTVAATGSGLTYQWQLSTDGGGTYNDIVGATASSYSVTGATAGMNGNRYRVIVTGTCAPTTATSTGAILTVVSSLSITSQPADVVVCVGANASFTVAATGSTITYQWQVSTDGGGTWNNIAGANAATFTITGVTASLNANRYRVNLTSPCGNATSNSALLTVNTLPAITGQPQNVNVCAGSAASFSVTATGTGITYQWQVSTDGGATWNNMPGETTSTLNLAAVTTGMNNNRYRVIVTGTCAPAATSNAAILNTAAAINITTQPVNSTICEGSNTSFTVAATGSGFSYQWQVSTDGGGTWNPVTNTGVYSGATLATLTITAAPPSLNNNRYRVVVSNSSCLPSTSAAATLTVNTFPQITGQPVDATICEGGNASFNVAATTGVGVLSYQWQVSTNGGTTYSNISGANTNTLALTLVTAGANGYRYRVIVTAGCGSVNSAAGVLTVNTLPVISFNTTTVVCISDAAFTLSATPAGGTFTGNGVSGNVFTPAAAGTGAIPVTYTATNAGCVSSATRVITVNECADRHLTLDQYPSVIIYPNPGNGQFNIRINTDLYTNLDVKVFNSDGQAVKSQTFNNISYGNILPLNLNNQAAGTYHVYLTNKENGLTSKSIKLVLYR